MLNKKTMLWIVGVITATSSAWAQTDAGKLLEQQRRTEPTARPAPPSGNVLTPDTHPTQAATSTDAGPLTTVRAFTLKGNTLLPEPELQAALVPWLNRPIGLNDLRAATAALDKLYRDNGWLVEVTLPAQDITEGQVTLSIAEAKRGRITVRQAVADKPVSPALTTRAQTLIEALLPEGQALSLSTLERALLITDETPGMRASGSLQASDTAGRTDVQVQLSPGTARQIDFNLDNSGSRSTGPLRASVQATFNAPLNWGDQFILAASKTQGSDYLRAAASLPMTLPFGPARLAQGWRAGVNTSYLRYRVLESANTSTGLPPQGTSQTLGADLQYPLLRSATSNWIASLGAEQKQLSNQDDNQTLGVLDITSKSRTQALSLGVNGNHYDQVAGGGANTVSLILTTGLLNFDGSPAAYFVSDSQNARTQGHFQKLRWSASRLQTLSTNFALLASASGQFSSQNLDASEKFYLGGASGVRAYPSAEAGGSTGQMISLELRQQINAQWLVGAFYDWGQVQQYSRNQNQAGAPLVANNTVNLQGLGLSASWYVDKGLQVKGTWAHRIGSNPLKTPNGTDTDGSLSKNRFWLNASYAL